MQIIQPNLVKNINPFPGLRAFTGQESHLFFGREYHVSDVLNKLNTNHFVAIVGSSGTGKSSLIKAGVLPELAKDTDANVGSSWEVVSMNPGSSPFQNLADKIVENPNLIGDQNPEEFRKTLLGLMSDNHLGLVQGMRNSIKPGQKLLVLVDQFEEVFRFSEADEKSAKNLYDDFVKLIIETVRQRDVPIYMILTLRSDFLGDCVRFEGLPEAINDGHYLVPRMTKEQMKTAITGPIKFANGKISPRLIQHITNDLGDNPDQLPVLQHALMRCWDNWKENSVSGEPMDLDHFRAIGDLDSALSKHANEAFAELNAKQQIIIEKVFKCLTTKKTDNRGVRRPMSMALLSQITEEDSKDIKASMVPFQKKGCSFLLPPLEMEASESTIYDISHESLMRGWDKLKVWVDEEMESSEFYVRICTSALLYQEGASALWRNPELKLALLWREKQNPKESWGLLYHESFKLGIDFIELSNLAFTQERKKKQRKTRLVRLSVLAFVLVICSLAGWALVQTNVANEKTLEAQQKSKEALDEKAEADKAREAALVASDEALSEKAIAEEQTKIAEQQKEIADNERGNAESAAENARAKQLLADQKSEEALDQKQKAEKATLEALRLRLKSTGENLAHESEQSLQNPELAALLAIESYKISKANGGATNDRTLYSASSKALKLISPNFSNTMLQHTDEVLGISFKEGVNVLDREGKITVYGSDNQKKNEVTLTVTLGEINSAYFDSYLNKYVLGLNSFDLSAGDIENVSNAKTISGHSGFVRAVDFLSSSEMITGGRDKQLIFWKDNEIVKKLSFTSRIKSISALKENSVCYVACENGESHLVNLENYTVRSFSNRPNFRIEAIDAGQSGNHIAIGYSDGLTQVYSKQGALIKEFRGIGSVAHLEINEKNDLLLIVTSGKVIYLQSLSNLSQPPIQIQLDRPVKAVHLAQDECFVYLAFTDRSIRKYPLKTSWYISKLETIASRTLSEEEWNSFIGSDIPYNAITPEEITQSGNKL